MLRNPKLQRNVYLIYVLMQSNSGRGGNPSHRLQLQSIINKAIRTACGIRQHGSTHTTLLDLSIPHMHSSYLRGQLSLYTRHISKRTLVHHFLINPNDHPRAVTYRYPFPISRAAHSFQQLPESEQVALSSEKTAPAAFRRIKRQHTLASFALSLTNPSTPNYL